MTLMTNLSIYDADMPMLRVTLISMPVNTNDAFTGVSSIDLSKMAVGDVMTMDTVAYDAGTEKNAESASTIPGPAGGGEGFNPMRDDSPSIVSMHSGKLLQKMMN
ncbi:MAG: spondin domain-containing protein [Rhizobium sp.]|nr:spondin domain-containing protein [Rhizobium sp.]